jgi:hypothetical protein
MVPTRGQHRRGKLDDDRQHVVSFHEVDAGIPERGGRLRRRQLGERTGDRLPVGQDAEELLEVDEEGITARAGE